MDGRRFDDLTRPLAVGTSRRLLLRALGGGLLGGALALAGQERAACQPYGGICLRHSHGGRLRPEGAPLQLPRGHDADRRHLLPRRADLRRRLPPRPVQRGSGLRPRPLLHPHRQLRHLLLPQRLLQRHLLSRDVLRDRGRLLPERGRLLRRPHQALRRQLPMRDAVGWIHRLPCERHLLSLRHRQRLRANPGERARPPTRPPLTGSADIARLRPGPRAPGRSRARVHPPAPATLSLPPHASAPCAAA